MRAVEFPLLSDELRNRRYRYTRHARDCCLRHTFALDRHCEHLIWRYRLDRMRFAFIFLDEIAENLQIVLLWSGKTWRVQQLMHHSFSAIQPRLGPDRPQRK